MRDRAKKSELKLFSLYASSVGISLGIPVRTSSECVQYIFRLVFLCLVFGISRYRLRLVDFRAKRHKKQGYQTLQTVQNRQVNTCSLLVAIESHAHSLELLFHLIFVVASVHSSSCKLWF